MSRGDTTSLASKFAGTPSRRGSSLSGLLNSGAGPAGTPAPVPPAAAVPARPAPDDAETSPAIEQEQPELHTKLQEPDESGSSADESAADVPDPAGAGSSAAGGGVDGTANAARGRRRGAARKPTTARRTPVYFDAATAEKLRAATRTGGRTYADLAALAFRSVPASELPGLFEPDDAGGDEIPMSEPRGGRGTELQFHFSAAQLAWIKRAQDTCRVKSRSDFIATVVSAYLSRSRA